MKKNLALFLPLLFCLQNIPAQTVERSLSAGFSTITELVKPYGSDKWLMACRGEPEPGAYFQDTLFVAVIGHDGQIHLRKNLTVPSSETHYWHDVLVLPDGGILASFESTLCDVGAHILTIQRLDAQGNLMWEKSGGFVFGTARPPEKWFLAPDGNLLGTGYNEVWKVAPSTGDILWKAELEGVNGGNISTYEFALIAGTEDFFGLGTPDFQIWKLSGDPGSPVYLLEKSLALPGHRTRLTPGPNGKFYCIQSFPIIQIESVNLDLSHQSSFVSGATELRGMTVGEQGLYLMLWDGAVTQVRKYDFQGWVYSELPEPNALLFGMGMSYNNGQLALFGVDAAGDYNYIPWTNDPPQSNAAWLRAFPETSPTPIADTPNAAVTGIEQLYTIDTTRFPAFPSGYVYNLFGGGFRVKIRNLGNAPLSQVCVNTSFQRNEFFDICYNVSARQKHFSNLNLAPGESVWLDFGDIQANGQAVLPSQICFWTSSPNQQPDAIHEDDRKCHPASYTVGVKNPDFAAFTLSPNPADGFAEISFSENMEEEKWQIFDPAGRLCADGICLGNGQTIRVETAQLPAGFYLISIQNRTAKLVVQH